MADIIDFSAYTAEEPDIETIDREELHARLKDLHTKIEALDEIEPEDMDSEEYDDWAGQHEQLEDLLDEILDRLDCME